MSNGTDKDSQQWHQAIQHNFAGVRLLQCAPAEGDSVHPCTSPFGCTACVKIGNPADYSLPVPANRTRSCSSRSPAMALARSITLHATQKPTFPALMNSPGQAMPLTKDAAINMFRSFEFGRAPFWRLTSGIRADSTWDSSGLAPFFMIEVAADRRPRVYFNVIWYSRDRSRSGLTLIEQPLCNPDLPGIYRHALTLWN